MSELDGKLQDIFSSPEAMEQVMSIARGLMSSAPDSETTNTQPEPPRASEETAPAFGGLDLSLLSNLDPKLISLAMNAFGEYSREDNDIKLLHAIKPHMPSDRVERVEHAVQILKLSKAVRAAMRGFGGGAENV